MMGRLLFGHLPDRLGGAKVALVCVLIEAAGQALIWLAPGSELVLIGAALTGFGYSLVYPGFGVEAIRRAPPQSRGLAMGAYTAFLDLALGLANPALGLIAGGAGLASVFLVSTLVVLCAAAMAIRLLYARSPTHDVQGLQDGVYANDEIRRRSNETCRCENGAMPDRLVLNSPGRGDGLHVKSQTHAYS